MFEAICLVIVIAIAIAIAAIVVICHVPAFAGLADRMRVQMCAWCEEMDSRRKENAKPLHQWAEPTNLLEHPRCTVCSMSLVYSETLHTWPQPMHIFTTKCGHGRSRLYGLDGKEIV